MLFVDLAGYGNYLIILPFLKISNDQFAKYIFIFGEISSKAGFIQIYSPICLPCLQVGICQHNPVIECIGKSKIVFQLFDLSAGIKYLTNTGLNLVNIPAIKNLCEKISNTANDWDEDNHPDPVILFTSAQAMNDTDNLQNNCNNVKVTATWK